MAEEWFKIPYRSIHRGGELREYLIHAGSRDDLLGLVFWGWSITGSKAFTGGLELTILSRALSVNRVYAGEGSYMSRDPLWRS
jgi:hypothetical protein